MVYFLDNLLKRRSRRLNKKLLEWDNYQDYDPAWIDNLAKEPKRGPGRPKGSRNKPKERP